jgi:hypothetical protein
MHILIQYLLPSLHPEVLKTHFIFLLGFVASPEVGMLPRNHGIPILFVIVAGIFSILCLRFGPYPAWYEMVIEKANQTRLISATKPKADLGAGLDADLETQPLNFPPIPDTLDTEFNPWTLPRE